jgi:hypothetical protein
MCDKNHTFSQLVALSHVCDENSTFDALMLCVGAAGSSKFDPLVTGLVDFYFKFCVISKIENYYLFVYFIFYIVDASNKTIRFMI